MTLMYVTSCRFVYSFEYSLTVFFFFFNDTATTEIYTLSLHDALPISEEHRARHPRDRQARPARRRARRGGLRRRHEPLRDRKSTRLNSSHLVISYAVFCLKKKKNTEYWPYTNTRKV